MNKHLLEAWTIPDVSEVAAIPSRNLNRQLYLTALGNFLFSKQKEKALVGSWRSLASLSWILGVVIARLQQPPHFYSRLKTKLFLCKVSNYCFERIDESFWESISLSIIDLILWNLRSMPKHSSKRWSPVSEHLFTSPKEMRSTTVLSSMAQKKTNKKYYKNNKIDLEWSTGIKRLRVFIWKPQIAETPNCSEIRMRCCKGI